MSQHFVLKTVYKTDVRRVRVDLDSFGWKELKQLLRKQFKDVNSKRLTYVDEDGDTITVTNQEELSEYFRVARDAGWKSLKIRVGDTSSDGEEDKKPSMDKDKKPFMDEDKKQNAALAIHWGFTCDGCGVNPIRGTRYHKRGENYDLCESEFSKLTEEDKKAFEAIEVPIRGRWWRRFRAERSGQQGWRGRRGGGRRVPHQNFLFKKLKWCARTLTDCDETQLLEALKSTGGAAAEAVEPLRKVIVSLRDKGVLRLLKQLARSPTVQKFKTMLSTVQEKIQAGSVAIVDAPGLILNSEEYAVAITHLRDVLPKLAIASERIANLLPKMAMQLPLLMPKLIPVFAGLAFGVKKPQQDQGQQEVLRAAFVKDDTLEDGVKVEASTTVLKSWTITNTGKIAWPESTALLHVGGDLELRAEKSRVIVGAVQPGKEVSVSVKLTTPSQPGRVWSYWRLVTGTGPSTHRFGLKVWADIHVVEKNEKKKKEEEEEDWELPDVPTNSTMIGTDAFPSDDIENDDVEEEKTSENDDAEDAADDADLVVPGVSSSSSSEDLGPWKAAVDMLQDMGFDPQRFRDLLKRHNGDIQAIMADMLK